MKGRSPAPYENQFQFGANWARFLSVLDDDRIGEAEQSLSEMLQVNHLSEKSFLDVGCGSGLFSLAARRLGARVYSFDYDAQSVACAVELKRRSFPNDAHWTIEQGSILDWEYLKPLGKFDIVYSWGVLHHTGAMWQALENVSRLVAPGGRLFVSIYNDQGFWSVFWKRVKKLYNDLPRFLQLPFALAVMLPVETRSLLFSLVTFRLQAYIQSWTQYKKSRGMSRWHDLIDWVGGYPFEVAKPEEIFDFYRKQKFTLIRLKTCGGGWGCNEFVFEKDIG